MSTTNSMNDCKIEPEDVIDLCDEDELETQTIKKAKSVTRICQQDSAIHVCCTETFETIEKLTKFQLGHNQGKMMRQEAGWM